MEVEVTVKIPQIIYDIYAAAAKDIGNYSVEQVMSSALLAYAQHLYEEMLAGGQLKEEQ